MGGCGLPGSILDNSPGQRDDHDVVLIERGG